MSSQVIRHNLRTQLLRPIRRTLSSTTNNSCLSTSNTKLSSINNPMVLIPNTLTINLISPLIRRNSTMRLRCHLRCPYLSSL